MAFTFPDIDPVAFSVGPFLVRWYALAYIAGFLGGWRYALYLAGLDPESRPTRQEVDDFLPWIIIGVIAGGRLGYVVFYNSLYYMANPIEILQLWDGGMSFHGGALGVIAMLIIYPLRRKFNPFRLSDIVCACVPIGLFFGRLANFVNGELYGRVTDMPWGIVFPRGGAWPRHPSQLYEAALEGVVLFLILFVLIRLPTVRQKPGIVSGAFLVGYGVFRGAIEFFREPDVQIGYIAGFFSMGQILSLPMVLVGMGIIAFAYLGKTGGQVGKVPCQKS